MMLWPSCSLFSHWISMRTPKIIWPPKPMTFHSTS